MVPEEDTRGLWFAAIALMVTLGLSACSRPASSPTTSQSVPGNLLSSAQQNPFSYPKAVWTESLIDVGSPTHLWRQRANEDSSAASFLFADRKSVHLVIVSSDGRIVHQDTFAGIIEFNSENFQGDSGYHGLQYQDEKTALARIDLETMPGTRWLVWLGIRVSDAGKAWMYSVYADGKWNVVSGNGAGPNAIADYTGAISIKPGFAEAYYNRASVLAKQGHSDEAINDYSKAIALDPTAAAYNDRGAAYGQAGQYDLALADFMSALTALYTEEKTGHRAKALAYFNRGMILQN